MDKTVITDIGRNLLIANKICSGTGTSDKVFELFYKVCPTNWINYKDPQKF